MGVNSSFKGFFNHPLHVLFGRAMVMLTLFVAVSSFTKRTHRDLRAKEVNVLIREIGHRLLQQSGDDTSRVLPVAEIQEGTFLLTFESKLVFNNDSLMALTQRLLPKTQFPLGYTVTVHDCNKADIVYGFQVNNNTPDVLPCKGRNQLPGCYTIEIAFPDFYENSEENNADMHPVMEEVKSVEEKGLAANSSLTGNVSVFGNPFFTVVLSGMLILLGVAFWMVRFRKNVTPAFVQHQEHAVIATSTPEGFAIGKFLFDVKGQRLLSGDKVISLTEKEYKILELLHKNFGELIPRETLMQEIWINEGVFTGRSLDMFVSKLRKKLSSDPALRITNVHGKGYKLEIPKM
jgi:hypothetical protein